MHTDRNNSTIQEALTRASSRFHENAVRHPRLSAEVLMQHLLGIGKAELYARLHETLPNNQEAAYFSLVDRRLQHEPLQYITEESEFYGEVFRVRQGVLIPRPETEILVEWVIRQCSHVFREAPVIADIGTGSGAIAVSLAKHLPTAKVFAVDVSSDALDIAHENAVFHNVEDRVRFLQGDLLQPLLHLGIRTDVVVSNPPYIPRKDIAELDREVHQYEPELALDGGADGLDLYRRLCRDLPRVMTATRGTGLVSLVAFEVGMGQAKDVSELLLQALQGTAQPSRIESIPDLAGIPRIVAATLGTT